MAENTLIVGAGAGILGLLLGYAASGPDTDDLVAEITKQTSTSAETAAAAGADQMKALDGKLAASAEQLSAMDANIARLEKALAASQEGMDTKLDEAVKSLTARMDAVSADLGKTVADAGTAQTEKLESALSASVEKIEGSIGQIALAAAPAAATEDSAPAAPAEPEIDGVRVGQTEVLMDGAVRVFVSSVDQEAKTARVAVNGLSMEILGGYKDVTFEVDEKTCTLLLDDVVEGHVQISTECGD